jgi:hypothetical protein
MSTCLDCFGTHISTTPCTSVGCLSTNYAKCITYSGLPLACGTGAISTVSKAGLALSPTVITEYTVSPTGGSGSGASVKVTRTPGSNVYTVTLLNGGSGYTVGNFLTVLGTSLGGATPANDLTLQVTTLAAIIATGTNLDVVVSNLHQRICNLTASGLDYSAYNYGCLRLGGNLDSIGTAITSAQGFVESVATALCSVDNRVVALETPAFTVPGCISLTSGVSTISQILTAYGAKICSINTQLDLSGVTAGCFTTAPSSTADLQVWFDWVVTNVCSIKTTTDANVTSVTTNANNLKTYISGGSAVPASIDTSCITGGSSTSTLSAAAILFTSQICAINTTLATIPATNYTLTWATNFGTTPYYGYTFNYTNTSDTLSNQLTKIVAALGRMKMKLNASDFTASSDSDGLNVSLASGVRFTCSQLNSCSISALADVTTSAPAIFHTLFWNGSEFVNKELIFTSTGGTVTATRTNNATDITVNLESTLSTPVRYNFTPVTVIGATNGNSLSFPTTPGSGYLMGVLHEQMVTLNGSIRITSTGSLTLTSGSAVDIATAPVAIRPATTIYLQAKVFVKGTTPFIEPTGSFDAMVSLDSSGVLRLIPYPVYPGPTSTVYSTAGVNIEIVLGGLSYTTLP